MSFMCSYRNRVGEVCKVESLSPRCVKHANKHTHVLCINCDAKFTSSYLSICNAKYCASVRESHRSIYKRQRSYYNAEFDTECIKMLENNAIDMTT